MALFSKQEIAAAYGCNNTTTLYRHIKKLEQKKLFKKTAVGKFFNEADAKKLADLLGFDYNNLFLKSKR